MSKITELIGRGAAYLEGSSSTPRLDVEVLLRFISGKTSTELVLHREEFVSSEFELKFFQLLERRKGGEPVAYLLGSKEFYGREFKVTKFTLIPRPESEHLIEQVLKYAAQFKEREVNILDLGTGSGCLLITLVTELSNLGLSVKGVGVDVSTGAIETANFNKEQICKNANVAFRVGSWWQPIKSEEKFSIIITNPPYISIHDKNVSKETAFEPQSALYSGKDGLEAYQLIVSEVMGHLEPEGIFLGEFGATQAYEVGALVKKWCPSLDVSIVKDLAGLDRLFIAKTSQVG